MPPTLNLDNPSVDPKINLRQKAQEREVKAALSNSFGFGGTNASLVFKAVEQRGLARLKQLILKFRGLIIVAAVMAVSAGAVILGLVICPACMATPRVFCCSGASSRTIAGNLAEAGVLRSGFLFRLYVRSAARAPI